MRCVLVLAIVSGCGRIAFDHIDADPGDAAETTSFSTIQVFAPGYVTAASQSITLSVDVGHCLVAAVYWNSEPNTITVTDTSGLAWTALQALITPSCPLGNGLAGLQFWYAFTTAPGSTTVTVTQTAGNPALGMYVIEYDGVAMTPTVEMVAGLAAPGASNEMTSGPLTTHHPDHLVALFANPHLNGRMTAGAGWTALGTDTLFYSLIEDETAAPGTVEAIANLPAATSDSCWGATAVAFRGR